MITHIPQLRLPDLRITPPPAGGRGGIKT